jgi:hypothetical protein
MTPRLRIRLLAHDSRLTQSGTGVVSKPARLWQTFAPSTLPTTGTAQRWHPSEGFQGGFQCVSI